MFSKFSKQQLTLGFILLVTAFAVLINLPKIPVRFSYGPINVDTVVGGYSLNLFSGKFVRDLKIKKGLDLQGGVHVVLEADMNNIPEDSRREALEAAKEVITRRVDYFGVAEPVVQTSKIGSQYRIIVELPGVTDTQEAVRLIGQTARLEFKKPTPAFDLANENSNFTVEDMFAPTDLSGSDLVRAQVSFDPKGLPQVAIKFSNEGALKFEVLTEELVGKPLAIFLDDSLVSAPRVQEKISGGEAVINGEFTIDEAKQLTIQLNAGALPVSVRVVEQKNIGATLGAESVQKSTVAGLVGLFLVALFMILVYGRLGFLAVLALIDFALISLSLYRLVPVTLTLAGIAGFVLSVGMAVDSNILIFERIKEELRAEKPFHAALELGFGRAWDSIRDANICTLITAFILYNPFNWAFLNTSGLVRGFALTLFLGILVSLFTGIVVTRTLVRLFYKEK
ncbi:MAG: protein translocase subunit SecD [bacterium]